MFLVIKERQNRCEPAQELYCNDYLIKSRVETNKKGIEKKIIGPQFLLVKITLFF